MLETKGLQKLPISCRHSKNNAFENCTILTCISFWVRLHPFLSGMLDFRGILSFNSELIKLSHFSLLLVINNWAITRKRLLINFRQVDVTSNFPLMSQRITLYENKTMRIFRECQKLELFNCVRSLTKARFIDAPILNN